MKPDRTYFALYGIYFLLLAGAWLVTPQEAWRGVIFFVTYASATIAIVTLGYLLERR